MTILVEDRTLGEATIRPVGDGSVPLLALTWLTDKEEEPEQIILPEYLFAQLAKGYLSNSPY